MNPNTGKEYLPPKGRHWRTTEEEYYRFLADGRIIFGKTGNAKPQLKRFYYEAAEKGVVAKSMWDDVGTTTNGTQELEKILGEKKFNNPKPVSLILKILEFASFKDSTILDFFAGSGTTGHAVIEMNKKDGGSRKFILCTNNENNICTDVTYPRIEKVIHGYADIQGIPANLKYYTQTFVPVISSDMDKRELVNRSTEILCVAEDCFKEVKGRDGFSDFVIFQGTKKQMAIIYDEDSIYDCVEYLNLHKSNVKTIIYVFSYDYTYDTEDFRDLNVEFSVKPIPEAIINVYRKISRMKKK